MNFLDFGNRLVILDSRIATTPYTPVASSGSSGASSSVASSAAMEPMVIPEI